MNNEYKSVSKFLNNKKSEFSFSKVIKNLFSKILVCVLLLLVGLIVLKYDKNNSQIIYKFIYEDNISFAKIKTKLENTFGDILPFEDTINKSVVSVFNEELTYKSVNKYKDGISLEVEESYLIPSLEEGIVIFIGEKDDYGKTIIIEQTNGVNVWYGNLENVNVTLYDYVAKGEFVATPISNNFYLLFEKEGEFVSYKEYLN